MNKKLMQEEPMKAKLPKYSASSKKEEKTPLGSNDSQKTLQNPTEQSPQNKPKVDPQKVIEEDGNIRFRDVTDEYEGKGFVFLGGMSLKGVKKEKK